VPRPASRHGSEEDAALAGGGLPVPRGQRAFAPCGRFRGCRSPEVRAIGFFSKEAPSSGEALEGVWRTGAADGSQARAAGSAVAVRARRDARSTSVSTCVQRRSVHRRRGQGSAKPCRREGARAGLVGTHRARILFGVLPESLRGAASALAALVTRGGG